MRNKLETLSILGVAAGIGYWLVRYFSPQHSVLVLDKQVVVITGASSGIGRELALAFAQRGAKVILAARRREPLEAVKHEIAPYAAEVLVVKTDLIEDSDIKNLVETTLAQFGRIDVLVNNAGITHSGYLHDQDGDMIRQMIDIDLIAAIRLSQEVLPHMLLQRQGYIVNIGSVASRMPAPLFSSYAAAKAGLAGFTDSLRRELKGSGIRVMLAMPAWTRTEMLRPEWQEARRYIEFPVQEAEQVANAIVEGLVRGEREIIFGGIGANLTLFLERHLPRVMNLYWRVMLGRQWATLKSSQPEHLRYPD